MKLLHFRWWVLIPLSICFTTGQSPNVSRIQIVGNIVTKEHIIQREIQHPVGVPLDSSIANDDKNRIENLQIFSNVSWKAVPLEDGTVLLKYQVIESWRIFPGILPQYDENTGWSLSGGVIVNNFRGRNQTFAIGGQVGGTTAYGLQYYDPWITGDHISLEFSTGKNSQYHTYLPYEISTSSIGLIVGRYFGYEYKTQIGLDIETKSFTNDSSRLAYKYLAPQGRFEFDTRDIYNDPSKGMYFLHSFNAMIDITGNKKHRLFWTQSYSFFKALIPGEHRLVIGYNLYGKSSFGDIKDDVWSDYIGGAYSVRGWNIPNIELYSSGNNDYRFGLDYLVSTVELRQTIIPRFATKYKSEFGLSVAAFIDAGIIGNSVNDLSKQQPILGAGVGIQIPLAIFQIIRMDYGWGFRGGKLQDRSFHFSFGQKF